MDEGATEGGVTHEDAASSPQEPFLGMRFDTIEAERAHYNDYGNIRKFRMFGMGYNLIRHQYTN
jgi:hypothetical protein